MSVSGKWFRWNAYDLDCGIIVPAKGATAFEEYDPWDAFRENEGKYRTVEQPYSPLLDLGRELSSFKEHGIRPSICWNVNFLSEPLRGPQNEADAAILRWVNTHGLLGILPVTTSEIRGPVDVMELPTSYYVTQAHFFRIAGRWEDRSQAMSGPLPPVSDKWGRKAIIDEVVQRLPEAGATESTWFATAGRKEDWVRRFYLPVLYGPRSLDSMSDSPSCPGSPDFHEYYSEPLSEFCRWVESFRHAALDLHRCRRTEEALHRAEEANTFLASLAQSAAPSFRFYKTAGTQEERHSAGLLASYALMCLWDDMDGRRALECTVCGKYFVSDEFRATYCSATCRNTASKRRARARKAEQRGE
jgi:hypothetical protein